MKKYMKYKVIIEQLVYFSGLVIAGYIIFSPFFAGRSEQDYFDIPIIDSEYSNLHALAVSKQGRAHEFYIDGEFFFSTSDISRFSESLVIPALNLKKDSMVDVLFLGYPCGYIIETCLNNIDKFNIKLNRADLAAADMAFKNYFEESPYISDQAAGALKNKKLNCLDLDNWLSSKAAGSISDNPDDYDYTDLFLKNTLSRYDLIFINSPDPINEKTQKWYDREFYNLIKNVMKKGGVSAQHITSPFFTPQSLGIIEGRINSVFKGSIKIRTNIPSMGEWSFCFFQDHKIDNQIFLNLQTHGLKFLNKQVLHASLYFPKDKTEQIFSGNKGYKDDLWKVFFKEWQEYIKMSDFD